MKPRILSVVGARPEIIQAAPLAAAFAPIADEIIVHTGQHYDHEMSQAQILAVDLPTRISTSRSGRARTPSSSRWASNGWWS